MSYRMNGTCWIETCCWTLLVILGPGCVTENVRLGTGERFLEDVVSIPVVDVDLSVMGDAQVERPTPSGSRTKSATADDRGGLEWAEHEEKALPNHDVSSVDTILTTELGQALELAFGQSDQLAGMFNPSPLHIGLGFDFATVQVGDALLGEMVERTLRFRQTVGRDDSGFGQTRSLGEIAGSTGRVAEPSLFDRRTPEGKTSIQHQTPETAGSLTAEQITLVVRLRQRGIQHCYEQELRTNQTIEGQVIANWTIALDGTVSNAAIEEDTIGMDNLESCILGEIGRMSFPEPGDGLVAVRYRFTFRVAN